MNNQNIIKKDIIKFRIIVFIILVFFCCCFTLREFQNDTFYMIKLGNYIVHNGIDLKDHWSWIAGLKYTYPHWLYDVYIYFVYNYFGYNGVYLSTICSFILLIFCVYYVNLKINNNDFMAFFVSFLTIISSCFAITARAQVFSYIIFILEIFFIFKLIESKKKKYVIYLSILSLLLANIHATVWLFYFILFLPFFVHEFIYFLQKKYKFNLNKKIIVDKINGFKYLLFSFVLSFMMGLFSPSRICYSYIIRIMLGDSQKFISEHFPLIPIRNPIFLGIIVIILIVLIFSKTKIKLYEIFMLSGLCFMSLISFRHIIFFYLIGGLFISIIVTRYFKDNNDLTFNILLKILVNNRYVFLIFIVFNLCVGGYTLYNNFSDSFVNKKEYPISAVKYIKKNLDYKNIKIFNQYNYGSYMMFKGVPVFVDSRCDLYLNEFNSGVNVFNDVVSNEKNYNKIFKKYGIEYALVKNDSYLYELLYRDIEYISYKDNYFTLFRLN